MPFACQNDSYLTSWTAYVQTLTPAECKFSGQASKDVVQGYEVVLDDTILFPEGGGQPDDTGTISGIPVLKVWRRGAQAVHFVQSPIEVGSKVYLKVDWERRFDHMQQHTGQHLITAIADQKYGFKTTSWDLGKSVSFIELDTPTMTVAQMQEVEDVCNKKIREATHVKVHVTDRDSSLLENVRARGLPDDHVGKVRIIEIDGVDANMCCGTHVRNLSDLMCVKLLSIEKGKKGKSNLYFLVGNRVLTYVGKKYSEEKALTKALKVGPADHVEAVQRIVKQLKLSQKVSTNLLREIAGFEGNSFKIAAGENKFVRLHRREGNNEYMNIVANELKDSNLYLFLTAGDEKGEGLFLLFGPSEFMEQCAQNICDVIKGKGALKGNRMQGKAGSLKESRKVEEIIRTFIDVQAGT